jgi:hypothetical protein
MKGQTMQTQYEHVQRGGWQMVLLAVAVVLVAGAWLARADQAVMAFNFALAGVFLLCALLFGSLTVRDEGDRLVLRYGPQPLLRKRIRYADITSVEPGRTSIIDGWGIHYIPCRGWTYNLWGFGCVKVTLGRKVIRIGSDDVENLAAFLKTKTQ